MTISWRHRPVENNDELLLCSAEYQRIRAAVLERDRYLCRCEECVSKKRTLLATEVDHIVPRAEARRRGWTRAQTHAMSNLRAINKECHARKTREERGQRYYGPRARIGVDGYPIE